MSDHSFEAILQEMLDEAPAGVDTREGSVFYDAVSACAIKLAKFYVDISCTFDLVFISTASGEYLDLKGSEYGVPRNPSTNARYSFTYEGAKPSSGERFFADGRYFTLVNDSGVLYLEAETAGTSENDIAEGTSAVSVSTIEGLTASSFGAIAQRGSDEETDDDLRERIQEKIKGPAQNGNKQHYKTWCEEVAGVGRARIIPLWAGENTVKGVIFDSDGLPASESVVAQVQEYIDPGGSGLGEGKANIGAHFTAVSADGVELTISFSAVIASGYTESQAKAAAENTLRAYFKELAMESTDDENIVVRTNRIISELYELPQLADFDNLTINGQNKNVDLLKTDTPVLKEVCLVVSV